MLGWTELIRATASLVSTAIMSPNGCWKISKASRGRDMLSSGLPEDVADGEDLARFLTSSNQFNTQMAKPSVFLPTAGDRETSVFRHGSEPPDALWAIGDEHAGRTRRLHGAAIMKAGDVRATLLEVIA